MAKKVLITTRTFGKFSAEPASILEKAGLTPIYLDKYPVASEDELLPYLDEDVVAILPGLETISSKSMDAAPGLKVVSKHGVGVDRIDLAAAKERNIAVTFTPGVTRFTVAEAGFALMMAVARRIPQADRCMRGGGWNAQSFFGTSVYGRTLGIVGLGKIGKAMAMLSKGFNMTLLGYDPMWDDDFAKEYGVRRCTFDELLQESDYVTLHAPSTPDTENLMGAREFGLMKNTACLINVARGELIDDEALYNALLNKQIAGAGQDAFRKEPSDPNDPLLTLENIVVTPHIAGYTDEGVTRCSIMAAQNIVKIVCEPKPDVKPEWVIVDADY